MLVNAQEWMERVVVPFTAMIGAEKEGMAEEEEEEEVVVDGVTVTEERLSVPADALKRVQSGVDEGDISK